MGRGLHQHVADVLSMASLVSRIKGKVHRRSGSLISMEHVRDEEDPSQDERPSSEAPGAITAQGSTRTSLENSAFHISRGGAVRPSHGKQDNVPRTTEAVDACPEIVASARKSLEHPQEVADDAVPDRSSSKRGVVVQRRALHKRDRSLNDNGASEDLIPERDASRNVLTHLPKQRQETAAKSHDREDYEFERYVAATQRFINDGHSEDLDAINQRRRNSGPLRTPDVEPTMIKTKALQGSDLLPATAVNSGQLTTTTVPVAIAHASSKVQKHGKGDVVDGVHDNGDNTATAVDNLRLPEGYDLNNTERTYVTEEQRPAVTHENVIKQRTEIIQEAITRDIHVHHHYTYLQPIKVVEVLPAKHYVLDPKTGQKREIPTPPGWTLPDNLKPSSPDTTTIKSWTRHYLVNEEHPHGIPEPPPLKDEPAINNLRKEGSAPAQ